MHVFSHHIYNDLSFVCWENSRCARFKNPSCGLWCKTIRIHLNVCRLDKWGPVLKVLKVEQTAGECRTHGNYRTGSVDVCHLGQSVKTRFGSNKLLTMRTRRRRRKKRRRRGMGTRLVSPQRQFWLTTICTQRGKNGRWKQFKASF